MNPSREGHVREHRSVFAAVEKRLLVGIARRLPESVNADHLSILGLGSMLAVGAALYGSGTHPWLLGVAVAALVTNWLGDSLDGTVARVRDQQRLHYGYYVDHVIDLAGAVFLFGGLGLSALMSLPVAFVLLAAYLLVSAECYLATHVRGIFKMAWLGIGPTELRLLLAAGIGRAAFDPTVALLGREWLLFDVAGCIAAGALGTTFVVAAARNAAALHAQEPLPHRGEGPVAATSTRLADQEARPAP